MNDPIIIRNASENNLKSVSVEIPKNKLVVITGVSGSGKSSLIFDVLYREAESRYLGSFSTHARQFLGKMKRPEVDRIEGLSPAIAVKQQSSVHNQRSTVGTITGIYDYLRLLYARIGKAHRSLFSFNSPEGACPHCKGLGVEDRLDPKLMIADASKTLRQGALVLTAPNGYIIYSQVTLDVLDQVCRAEGFNVDIPWQDLTPEQQHIVLYGSEKIEIPYGKHPLESRMRWSGITAKPREMGYYKGILPVMENILLRDRNKNILRFVRTDSCSVCHGSRLNEKARSFQIHGMSIDRLCDLQLNDLRKLLEDWDFNGQDLEIAAPVIASIVRRIGLMERLGLGYLSLQRDSGSLSGGEAQRLRLTTQANSDLSGILYIFDEPSIGLHPHEVSGLIDILKDLRDKGNSVLVVEHDEEFIRQADWLIDVGPGPGEHGGEILVNSAVSELNRLPESIRLKSKTLEFLSAGVPSGIAAPIRKETGTILIRGARANNLKNIDVAFQLGSLNVVTGVSGAGKSTLVNFTLGNFLRNTFQGGRENVGKCDEISGWDKIGKIIAVDQSPIGRTPRSNPATYTGLFDRVRELFASMPEAVSRGFDKSRFSFNTPGGRCEACEGAGYQQIGMHFMGSVEVVCEACEGHRFDEATLAIRYRDKNIFEILELTINSAIAFFNGEPKILHYLQALDDLGLGYLTLGQRSSTLSGGEAQRVKLATELAKPQAAHTLYLLDEPTTGLHDADVVNLLTSLNTLVRQGHTVIVIEHHLGLIASAGHIIDLGPGSGREGGNLVFSGSPTEIIRCTESLTGQALKEYRKTTKIQPAPAQNSIEWAGAASSIKLKGVTTNNLKNISVEIPHQKITVITGVSGSGKSSLAFDTIFAEGQNRFLEGFSTYFRSQVGMEEKASFEELTGLTATFAIDQRMPGHNPRSTVGTLSEIYDAYRLLYSRMGMSVVTSSLFSFNHQHGACPLCDGLGFIIACDPEKLITHPERSILSGAMDGTKTGKFYGDPYGQYVATLKTVGEKLGIDFAKPWQMLNEKEKDIVLDGTGEESYQVTWEFLRNNRRGEYQFSGPWQGLINLVGEEYLRKHADRRGEGMMPLMKQTTCAACNGS
ncbi:MAG: excinuclease ABC subunit UvrA, partial [Bacteroidales bacterium]|nr:excinuclease ABC subunit UvrA [Bacteroidales bacterium]